MRVLHTADWHLGKRLHRIDLSEDHLLFFDWLLEFIRIEKVDALLLSGDVFDLANPSSDSRNLYYEILRKLVKLDCQLIITGGNHDSIAVLNAPKDLLKALNIHIVGGLPNDLQDAIIPLIDSQGKTIASVAALPYLRDSDLRQMIPGENYEDRKEAVRQGIQYLFDEAGDLCKKLYPDLPALAMGHLYAQGAVVSDSEREIQVGNQAAYDAEDFSPVFDYIALGHVHKPQPVGNEGEVHYSGSPIALSFSEKGHEKRVILINIEDTVSFKSYPVPLFRKLVKLTDNAEGLRKKLDTISKENTPLPTLIELEMIEEQYDPAKATELEELVHSFSNKHAIIVKQRIEFTNKVAGSDELYETSQSIDDLKPMEVFEKRMEKEDLSSEQKDMLRESFQEILELVETELA